MGGPLPRLFAISRAQRLCHQCTGGYRHADPERGGKEQDGSGITNRRRKLGFTQHRNEDHVDEIDQEHRHEPDGGRQRHHRDMAKQIAGQKLGLSVSHAGPHLVWARCMMVCRASCMLSPSVLATL